MLDRINDIARVLSDSLFELVARPWRREYHFVLMLFVVLSRAAERLVMGRATRSRSTCQTPGAMVMMATRAFGAMVMMPTRAFGATVMVMGAFGAMALVTTVGALGAMVMVMVMVMGAFGTAVFRLHASLYSPVFRSFGALATARLFSISMLPRTMGALGWASRPFGVALGPLGGAFRPLMMRPRMPRRGRSALGAWHNSNDRCDG